MVYESHIIGTGTDKIEINSTLWKITQIMQHVSEVQLISLFPKIIK